MTNTPDKSEMKADERILPEAPLWNGVGKYGPALCMDNCTLHIMSRGFGAKDGDGYLTHDPSECEWDRDDESGKDYVVVPVSNSDLLFLRDQLNKLFPSSRPPADMVERVARALCVESGDDPDDLDNSRICKTDGTPLPLWAAYEGAAIAALQAVPAASEVDRLPENYELSHGPLNGDELD